MSRDQNDYWFRVNKLGITKQLRKMNLAEKEEIEKTGRQVNPLGDLQTPDDLRRGVFTRIRDFYTQDDEFHDNTGRRNFLKTLALSTVAVAGAIHGLNILAHSFGENEEENNNEAIDTNEDNEMQEREKVSQAIERFNVEFKGIVRIVTDSSECVGYQLERITKNPCELQIPSYNDVIYLHSVLRELSQATGFMEILRLEGDEGQEIPLFFVDIDEVSVGASGINRAIGLSIFDELQANANDLLALDLNAATLHLPSYHDLPENVKNKDLRLPIGQTTIHEFLHHANTNYGDFFDKERIDNSTEKLTEGYEWSNWASSFQSSNILLIPLLGDIAFDDSGMRPLVDPDIESYPELRKTYLAPPSTVSDGIFSNDEYNNVETAAFDFRYACRDHLELEAVLATAVAFEGKSGLRKTLGERMQQKLEMLYDWLSSEQRGRYKKVNRSIGPVGEKMEEVMIKVNDKDRVILEVMEWCFDMICQIICVERFRMSEAQLESVKGEYNFLKRFKYSEFKAWYNLDGSVSNHYYVGADAGEQIIEEVIRDFESNQIEN